MTDIELAQTSDFYSLESVLGEGDRARLAARGRGVLVDGFVGK